MSDQQNPRPSALRALFDDYKSGRISRRQFTERAALSAVGVGGAAFLANVGAASAKPLGGFAFAAQDATPAAGRPSVGTENQTRGEGGDVRLIQWQAPSILSPQTHQQTSIGTESSTRMPDCARRRNNGRRRSRTVILGPSAVSISGGPPRVTRTSSSPEPSREFRHSAAARLDVTRTQHEQRTFPVVLGQSVAIGVRASVAETRAAGKKLDERRRGYRGEENESSDPCDSGSEHSSGWNSFKDLEH